MRALMWRHQYPRITGAKRFLHNNKVYHEVKVVEGPKVITLVRGDHCYKKEKLYECVIGMHRLIFTSEELLFGVQGKEWDHRQLIGGTQFK